MKMISRIFFLSCIIYSITIQNVLSQNLVKNPGFESGVLSPYWGSWPIGTSFANIDIANPFAGEFCAKLELNEVYFYQPVNLEPNTTYKIIATIKTESGDTVWFGVSHVNSTGGKSTYINDTNYKTDSLSFTTDESPGNMPNIYIWKKFGSGIVWVDNIEMIVQPEVAQPKPPGGFFGTYYVSPLGNDINTGISPGQAWQTIDKINSIDFGPGDKILFEGGKTFNGTIVLNKDDYGTLDNILYIGSYGTGRAIINAQTGSGFIAYDCSSIGIKNLIFTGNGRLNGNTGNGITFSYCSDIIIDSVEVSGFQHSGLMVNNIGMNYQITNVNTHDNGYSGIYISGLEKTSLSNIYIGYCIADNNPGDPSVLDNHSGNGIFAYNASNINIEYCEASNNGGNMPWTQNGPGGIWVAEVDSVVIQYCISHNNKTSSGAHDGLGFDLDGGTTNSIIQYCLSYNNHGAGYGIFQYPGATDWKNNIVRYCISENDGNVSAPGSIYFWNGTNNIDKFHGFEFYNNVVYNANGPALAFLDHKNSNFNFRNNIFVSKKNSVYNGITVENFQGNCWYSFNGQFQLGSTVYDFEQWAQNNNQEMLDSEIVGMYANPSLINPGNSNLSDPTQMVDIDDYKVHDTSVVIEAGLDLQLLFNIDPGVHDYFGNLIKQGAAFDIGVYQNIDKQAINLNSGWNIISLNIIPNDSNLLNIMQPLIDNGKLKKVMDESGKVIEDFGVFGGWQNTIGNLKNTEGYKINVKSEDTLIIAGIAVDLPLDIHLNTGWNIISWPSPNEKNGMDVFQSLINNGKLKKVMDETGQVIENFGVYGGWQNKIGYLKPGEGYKVNVTSECTFSVNESVKKSEEIVTELIPSSHFIPAYKGNGTDHMNIHLVNISGSGIMAGDEIGVFDGNTCVGSLKITNQLPIAIGASIENRNSISIPVSANDGIDNKNGYTEGNSITLKLFRNGGEYPLTIEPLNNGKSVFVKGSSLFAQIAESTSLEGSLGSNNTEIECYPNPFSEELAIEINLVADAEVQVEVLNQLGQSVKFIATKRTMPEGLHKFIWDGNNTNSQAASSGIYYLRIEIDDSVHHKKIVLSK